MPKKEGIAKTYSFDCKTISQMEYLSESLMLKNQTKLLEFLINEKYKKEIQKNARRNNLQKS